MPVAVVVTTPFSILSSDQGSATNQGAALPATPNTLIGGGMVNPGVAFKMRAWDTVAEEYVYWMSYGDVNGRPPTLNPVTNVTATRVSMMRTT